MLKGGGLCNYINYLVSNVLKGGGLCNYINYIVSNVLENRGMIIWPRT